jgi:hypothetical protein
MKCLRRSQLLTWAGNIRMGFHAITIISCGIPKNAINERPSVWASPSKK